MATFGRKRQIQVIAVYTEVKESLKLKHIKYICIKKLYNKGPKT